MGRKFEDHTGKVYGSWTVIQEVNRGGKGRGSTKWLARCACGNTSTVGISALKRGRSHRCVACFAASKRLISAEMGVTDHPLYRAWCSMRARCSNPRNDAYHNYGGRGITVCDRWERSFLDFVSDVGERPHGMSLDRRDNDGNYEPGNVRWADAITQNRNKRSAVVRKQLGIE